MTSVVQIWNMAMGHLGQSSIIQSESEKSVQANACKTFWDSSRKSALSAFDWNFARTYAELSQLDITIPTTRWEYAYGFPIECLALRSINDIDITSRDLSDPIPFEIVRIDDDRKALLCDLEEVVICYTADVINPNMYEPQFVESASIYLAANTCMMITKKEGLRQSLLGSARLATDAAAAQTMNERRFDPPRETASIRSRL